MRLTLLLSGRKARARARRLIAEIDAIDTLLRAGAASFRMLGAGVLEHCADVAEAERIAAIARDAVAEEPFIMARRHSLAQHLAVLLREHPEVIDMLADRVGPARIHPIAGHELVFYAPPPNISGARWPTARSFLAVYRLADPLAMLATEPPDAWLALTTEGVVSLIAPSAATSLILAASERDLIPTDAAYGFVLTIAGQGLRIVDGEG